MSNSMTDKRSRAAIAGEDEYDHSSDVQPPAKKSKVSQAKQSRVSRPKKQLTHSSDVHPSAAITIDEREREARLRKEFKTKSHLQSECQRLSLPTNGVKQTLINRIILSERSAEPCSEHTSTTDHSDSQSSDKSIVEVFGTIMQNSHDWIQRLCENSNLSIEGGRAELAGRFIDLAIHQQQSSQPDGEVCIDFSSIRPKHSLKSAPASPSRAKLLTRSDSERNTSPKEGLPGDDERADTLFGRFIYRKTDNEKCPVPIAMVIDGRKRYVTHHDLRTMKPAALWWTTHDITKCAQRKLLPEPRPENRRNLESGGVAYFKVSRISESSNSSDDEDEL